jgi:hypothetical protein
MSKDKKELIPELRFPEVEAITNLQLRITNE